MAISLPTADTRWRCAQCGNLTRFDVLRTTRSEEYVHADLAGESRVEERRVLEDVVERVTCRWCGSTDQIELVPRPGAAEPVASPRRTTEPGS